MLVFWLMCTGMYLCVLMCVDVYWCICCALMCILVYWCALMQLMCTDAYWCELMRLVCICVCWRVLMCIAQWCVMLCVYVLMYCIVLRIDVHWCALLCVVLMSIECIDMWCVDVCCRVPICIHSMSFGRHVVLFCWWPPMCIRVCIGGNWFARVGRTEFEHMQNVSRTYAARRRHTRIAKPFYT